jgi:hypothetical protein
MIWLLGLLPLLAVPESPPTWRVRVRNDATKEAKELEVPHSGKLAFAAGKWSCDLVSFQVSPEDDAVSGGRFSLTRFSAFLTCKRLAGKEELVLTTSAGSCVTADTAESVSAEVREFAIALVQRSYGSLHVTLGSAAKDKASETDRFIVDGGCFRPGLPPPPMGVDPPSAVKPR